MSNQSIAPRSRKPVYMVLCLTIFAALAQIMMKYGATHYMPPVSLSQESTWWPFAKALLTNYPLIFGYAVSALNALLLILALRDGQLSTLYPIISLTFVWVNLLSMYLFGDHMNLWKGMGILLVVSGVAILGKASETA
jgi:multidrug transporter EmrE-like cation transporter